MSYKATGSGEALLKAGVDLIAFTKMLEEKNKKLYDSFDLMEYDIWQDTNNNVTIISFWHTDRHWNAENTISFLNMLNPYITEGSIEYEGEEDDYWRYVFVSEEEGWKEEAGTIYYNDEAMIEDLEKQNYVITSKDNIVKLLTANEGNKEYLEAGYDTGYYEGYHDALVDVMNKLNIPHSEEFYN